MKTKIGEVNVYRVRHDRLFVSIRSGRNNFQDLLLSEEEFQQFKREVNEHAIYCGALHGAQKATLGRVKANFNEYSLAAEIVNRTLAVRAASTN